MTAFIRMYRDNPQPRLVSQVVDVIRQGGVVVYPTDSAYAIGCHLGDKTALQRIRQIRQIDEHHHFSLLCRDLSELSTFAHFDNPAYRFMKSYTPGPYTFILPATKEVPKRLLHPKRRTIGLRIPENPIPLAILEELNEPLMSTTLIMPGDELPLIHPDEIYDVLDKRVDLIVDGGHCGYEPTTVVNLTDGLKPEIIRQGQGEITLLQ